MEYANQNNTKERLVKTSTLIGSALQKKSATRTERKSQAKLEKAERAQTKAEVKANKPKGKTVAEALTDAGPGMRKLLAFLFGLIVIPFALINFVFGFVMCCTIIGIPLGYFSIKGAESAIGWLESVIKWAK